jgi:membrane protease YdiL (CAAX protease family)
LVLRIISIIYIIKYIGKEKLNGIKIKKLTRNDLLLSPLLILCCSNFFVALIQKQNLKDNIDSFTIISGLVISIGVGIVEELLFRSQVLEEFLKHKSKIQSILYSSLIFGSVHLLNISSVGSIPIILIQMCYTFFLGIILSTIYLSNRNILLPIIFHILFNFINDILIIEFFPIQWNITFFLVNIGVGLIVLLYAILISKKYLVKEEESDATENMDY